jgi:hypothetical protein
MSVGRPSAKPSPSVALDPLVGKRYLGKTANKPNEYIPRASPVRLC